MKEKRFDNSFNENNKIISKEKKSWRAMTSIIGLS